MDNRKTYNIKVLYVEDENDTLQPMERFLRRRFSSVIIAKDGEEGWRKFNEFWPDLIITDLLIPEYSGVDLIKRIRETGYGNPIIITSALQDPETIVKTVDLGISKYIIKPIDLSELDLILEKLGQEITEKQKQYFVLTYEEKKDCEAKLKHFMSNLLKKFTGKGPMDVKVLIGSKQIEIKCLNVRTTFENTLYQRGKNIALTEQSRRLLYQILRPEIEEEVSSLIRSSVIVSEISIDAKTDSEIIKMVTVNS